MQLRNRTYESSPAVTRGRVEIVNFDKYAITKDEIAFAKEFVKDYRRLRKSYKDNFVEKNTFTLREKRITWSGVLVVYDYLNEEQSHISNFQNKYEYKCLIRTLTKEAKEYEKKMNDHYEKETQKILTRSMKEDLSEFKALLELTKTELHKWCEYSEKY